MNQQSGIRTQGDVRLDKRGDPVRAQHWRKFRLFVIFLLLFLCTFGFVQTGASEPFDLLVRDFFYQIRTPQLTPVMRTVTFLASSRFIIGGIAVLLILPFTRRQVGLPLGITQLAAHGLYRTLNELIARPRPDPSMWLVEEHHYAFPSGHSLNGIVFYWMMLYLFRRAFGKRLWVRIATPVLAAVPFVVMFSRLYLGVHYLTDIVGGASLGIAVVCLASLIFENIQHRNKGRVKHGTKQE